MSKTIKQSNGKGSFVSLLLGLIFLIGGSIGAFMIQNESAQSLRDSNHIYKYSNSEDKKDSNYVINIQAIGEKTEADYFTYYYVLTNDNEIVVVEDNKDNSQIEQLYSTVDSEGFLPKSVDIAVRKQLLNKDTQNELKNYFEEISSGFKVETKYILSIVAYNENKLFTTAIAIGASILGIVLIVVGVIRRRNNIKQYHLLYEIYPELKDNLALLETDSHFYNKKLAISLYKDHLVTMKIGFDIFEMNKVEWMNFTIQSYYRSNRLLMLNILEKDFSKPKAVSLGKYKKALQDDIVALTHIINERYPEILWEKDNK